MITRSILLSVWITTLMFAASEVSAQTVPPKSINQAINQSLPLLQKSLLEYPKHVSCFSCHHQGMGLFALNLAVKHGYSVDKSIVSGVADHAAKDLQSEVALYQKGQGQPGGVTRAGYAMLALEGSNARQNDTISAVTNYLVQKDIDKGFWHSSSNRPPSELSAFTDTFLAVRALKTFGEASQKEKITSRIDKARIWLEQTPTKETEDIVFQIWGLKEAGASAEVLQKAATALLAEQRADGGWSQLPTLESDAYATGSALTVLLLTGSARRDDPTVNRAVQWLLKSQLTDGSWHVVSRSKPFQPYFESGFPHGKDQFISMAASCWATTGLILASRSGR